MASTSTSGRNPQNEPVTSEEIAAASAPSFFTSCFQWFSSLFPLCPDRSRSTASTSTSARQPEDDLTDLAFEGIAPSLPSQAMKKLPYDIFINHRGPDVKYTVATSIYRVLNGMTLSVFLDSEELELGDCLPREIEEAMRKALLHIAIFSPNYAESPWCLAELSFMLKTGIPIVPVFYHVEPADLRWVEKGKGVYAPAFSRHEKKRRYTPEKLQEWKKALQDASFYNGNIVNNNDDEGRLLKNIVNHVLEVIKKVPLVVAKHPVGLHEAVNEFESITHQAARSHHDVQIVGIWGMGGSGKTTLAKELYNQKSPFMERSSFLFDVRDAASKSLLYNKQRQLLEDLGVKGVSFDNIEQGKGIIANRLRLVRLLLILDDVDHVDQLDALLPTMESVGSGSLIIVTTRESEVLRRWGISSIYKMRTLTLFHAEQLFCWHAFLQPSPPDEFEELVKMFLAVCKGLPLSLKVFGGQLYGISCKDYWKSQLHKLSRILPNDVKQSLKISYDALDNEEKEIFLDVACFFIGEEKSLAIEVWNGSGWSGLHSWETLINKCLVELDEKNRIKMHDHLRDLGREIASQHYPLRIWLPEQVTNVQNEAEIRGIMATSGSPGEIDGLCALAASSRGLKIFVVRGRHVNQVLSVSTELVWLRCIATGHRNLPSPLSLKKMRVLQLHRDYWGHTEEFWEDGGELWEDAPVQLRELDMCDCKYLKRFPKSIGDLTNLKKLVMDNGGSRSSNLTSLPDEFCLLVSLEHLTLTFCDKLQVLPAHFGDLTNLRHLDLSWCCRLRMLPDSFKQLKFLHYLKFLGCKRLTLNLDMMENMTKLEYLNFNRCKELEELPSHITNQGSLRELSLMITKRLKELPTDIGGLSKLRVMRIAGNVLTRLPDSIGNLSSLTILRIDHCPKLESLPESVGCLTLLENLWIGPSKVQSLPHSIRQLSNLQTLNISDSPIRELDFGQGSFPSSLCNLKDIVLARTRTSKISISEDCCPSLEKLQICYNWHLTEITLVDLTSLKLLYLERCDGVVKVEGLEECRSLEELRADDAAGIQSLEHMDRLRLLHLETNNMSNVQPCTQTLKKWPAKTIICARAGPDAGSKHLNMLAFPNLSIIDSFVQKFLPGIHSRYSFRRLVQKRPSHADLIMAYFIINCESGSAEILLNNDHDTYTLLKGYGKWIWVCVLTQCRRLNTEKVFKPEVCRGEGYIEQGLLVTGEEKSLMEALPRLLSLLGR